MLYLLKIAKFWSKFSAGKLFSFRWSIGWKNSIAKPSRKIFFKFDKNSHFQLLSSKCFSQLIFFVARNSRIINFLNWSSRKLSKKTFFPVYKQLHINKNQKSSILIGLQIKFSQSTGVFGLSCISAIRLKVTSRRITQAILQKFQNQLFFSVVLTRSVVFDIKLQRQGWACQTLVQSIAKEGICGISRKSDFGVKVAVAVVRATYSFQLKHRSRSKSFA